MDKHIPNPKSWRPPLGYYYVVALIKLAEKRNASAMVKIGALDWLRKMIRHWWGNDFPGEIFPGDVSEPRYYIDLDF